MGHSRDSRSRRASQGRLRDWSIRAPQPLKDRSLHTAECIHDEIVIQTLPFDLVCLLKRKCAVSPPARSSITDVTRMLAYLTCSCG